MCSLVREVNRYTYNGGLTREDREWAAIEAEDAARQSSIPTELGTVMKRGSSNPDHRSVKNDT